MINDPIFRQSSRIVITVCRLETFTYRDSVMRNNIVGDFELEIHGKQVTSCFS